ncbi:hypothetical protein [Krasilnikovia sp. M28-CT-15]|uniref:hypothetical protein n=1 Tax=Krasilnikovia sp. M28-CT-15 TaxID=3373540 RepID=UPI00387743EA
MHLMFLGKETQGGGSPTLYATDRDTYLVQGWRVPDEPLSVVEIPESLLRHLLADTELGTPLHATGRRWHGDHGECATYTLAGAEVTDPAITARLNLPGHETCVEVALRRKDG